MKGIIDIPMEKLTSSGLFLSNFVMIQDLPEVFSRCMIFVDRDLIFYYKLRFLETSVQHPEALGVTLHAAVQYAIESKT